MIKYILKNKNSETLFEKEFEKPSDIYTPSKKFKEIPKFNHTELLENLDYGISTYIPYIKNNKIEDLLIQHLSQSVLKQCGLDSNDEVRGHLFSETLPIYTETKLLDLLKDTYKTGNNKEFILKGYEDDILFKYYNYKLVKSKEQLFIIAKDVTDIKILEKKEKQLFEDAFEGLAIYQDEKIVKSNKSFRNIINLDSEEFKDKNAIDIFYNNQNPSKKTKEIWKNAFLDILTHKSLFKEGTSLFIDKQDKKQWLRGIMTPTIYNYNPAVHIAIQNITEVKNLENESLKLKKALDIVEPKSKFSVFWWDQENGYEATSEFFNIIDKEKQDKFTFKTENTIVTQYISENYVSEFIEKFYKFKKGYTDNFEIITQLTTAKNNKKYVSVFISGKMENNNLKSYVGYVQDITDTVEKEEDLSKANLAKEVLLKEVHHRIKNNLQIILSLLNLELSFNKKSPREILDITKKRIESMALIHEKTYKSDDLANINTKEFIKEDINRLISLYDPNKEIAINFDLNQYLYLPMSIMTPISLINNELFTNTIKYAFDENCENKEISISLKEENENIVFKLEDNGLGLPKEIDIHNSPSLGLTIINSLATQLNGEISLTNCEGTGIQVKIPIAQE